MTGQALKANLVALVASGRATLKQLKLSARTMADEYGFDTDDMKALGRAYTPETFANEFVDLVGEDTDAVVELVNRAEGENRRPKSMPSQRSSRSSPEADDVLVAVPIPESRPSQTRRTTSMGSTSTSTPPSDAEPTPRADESATTGTTTSSGPPQNPPIGPPPSAAPDPAAPIPDLPGRLASGSKSAAAQAIKEMFLKAWSMRNLQDFYGDNKTVWGRAFKQLIDLNFRTAQHAQRSLQQLSHATARFSDFAEDQKKAIMDLMLMTQEYNGINPTLPFEQHTWLPKGTPEIEALSRKNYDRVVAAYNALGTDAMRKSFLELGEFNRSIAMKLLNSKKRNYERLQGLDLDKGGIPTDVAKQVIDAYDAELKALEAGQLNFSMQREGEWLVAIPGIPTLSSIHKTRAEAATAAQEATLRNPAIKTRLVGIDDQWGVEVSEPGLFTFESEQDALAALPGIRSDLLKHFKEHFTAVYPGDPEQAGAAAQEAFDRTWYDEEFVSEQGSERVPRVYAKQRSKLYDAQLATQYSEQLMAKLNSIKGRGLTEHAYNQLVEDYLRMSDKSAFSRSKLGRRNIRGASPEKMMEAYIKRYVSTAHALANSTEAVKKSELMADLESSRNQRLYNFRTGKNPAAAMNQYLNNQDRAQKAMLDNRANKVTTAARMASTMLNLAFSPSFVVINAAQPLMVGAPWLASKKIGKHQITMGEAISAITGSWSTERLGAILAGVRDAAVADAKRVVNKSVTKEQWSKDTIKGLMNVWSSQLPPTKQAEFVKLLEKLDEQDGLTLAYTDALYDAMDTGSPMSRAQMTLRLGMAGAKFTEVTNRFTMARAAFDLGTKYGLSGEALTEFVNEALYKTQGDFSRSNRAAIFNHPLGSIALQFQTYVHMMYSLFAEGAYKALRGTDDQKREGRRLLGNLLGTHATVAGTTGLGPAGFALKLALVLGGFGADDDDEHYLFNDMNVDTQFRKGLRELLDDPQGESMLYNAIQGGATAAIGVDAAERMQLPSLVNTRYIRSTDPSTMSDEADNLAMQVLGGAPWATAKRIVDGTSKVLGGGADGDTREVAQGIAQMTPSIVRGLLTAADKSSRGLIDSSGRVLIPSDDLNGYDLFLSSLGFRPTAEGEVRRARADYFDVRNDVNERRSELLKDYNRARGAGPAAVARAMQNISAFNARVPKALRITSESLESSRKSSDKAMRTKRDEAVREMLE